MIHPLLEEIRRTAFREVCLRIERHDARTATALIGGAGPLELPKDRKIITSTQALGFRRHGAVRERQLLADLAGPFGRKIAFHGCQADLHDPGKNLLFHMIRGEDLSVRVHKFKKFLDVSFPFTDTAFD
jgi:hypothetical protein